MSDYTPTTEKVRERASRDAARFGFLQEMDFERQFDRWLAAHDREVRAKELRDAATEIHDAVWTDDDVAQAQRRRDTWDWVSGTSDGVEFAARRLAERADMIEWGDADDQPE